MEYQRSWRYLIFLLPFWSGAQDLLPPVDNFASFQYQAATKNWGLAANETGELFVANNSGLLHFDGEQWKLYRLPNQTVIRSVNYIDGKVYTGSYEEFGYWEANTLGVLEYTSLTHLIQGHAFTSEEFWEIIPFNDQIVFRSFSAIYSYANGEIKVIDPTQVVSDIVEFMGELIVAGGTSGLYRLQGDTLLPLPHQEALAGATISDMVVRGNGMLIGTNLNGCFLYEKGVLTSWPHPLNEVLKLQQLNKMRYLTNGNIVFGTIKNGIYLVNDITGAVTSINKVEGLQNNTVLGLLQYENQLWVAEDNGIDRIQLNSPFTYFTDNTGALGTLYDLEFYDDRIYLGSNTGIYYLQDQKLSFVDGSQGHVWDLEMAEDDLMCGHNTGTFIVEEENISRISDYSGGYNLIKIPEHPASYLQGTYNGLLKYKKDDQGQWQVLPLQNQVGFPIKYLCFEDEHTIWAAHTYKGLYRIMLDDNYERVIETQEIPIDELPNAYNIKVYKIRNQIVLLSDGTWYKYDPIMRKISLFEEFKAYNGMDLLHHENGHYWFSNIEDSKEIIFTDLQGEQLVLEEQLLVRRMASESVKIIKQNDSIYYFTLTNGFARLDLSQFRAAMANFELPVPVIRGFRDIHQMKPLNLEALQIPYADARELTVEVSAASLLNPRYHYELKGPFSLTNDTDSGTLVFQNLPYGSYELNVSTIGADNNRSAPQKFSFRIRPPWYLSVFSLIAYGILAILGILVFRWYSRQKQRRRQINIKRQMHKEHQKRLTRLEKEKLAREVKRKQNELTGSTMQIARKNALILELKGLVQVNKEKFSNQQRYRAFMKKLNSTINDSQDWKRFEVNFNELHEDFFETLLKKYPRLTPKDLKLCAYLKMNLTTKEIAPLMGITVRGVEIHRYRLRKKLHIDGSQNISNFLITLKKDRTTGSKAP